MNKSFLIFIQAVLGLMLLGSEAVHHSGYKAVRYISMVIFLSFYLHPIFALFGIANNIVQRFHDIGKSGWFSLWSLTILAITYIWYLQFIKKSESYDNKYGPYIEPIHKGNLIGFTSILFTLIFTSIVFLNIYDTFIKSIRLELCTSSKN